MEKWILAVVDWFWKWAFPPILAFFVTVIRGLYSEDDKMKTFLEGCIIASLVISVKPVLVWMNLPEDLAIFLGVVGAVFGLEWIKALGDKLIKKYMK